MKKFFFITGASGFVGSNIVRRLVRNNDEVHILVRNKKLNWRLFDMSSSLIVHEGDLLSPNLDGILKEIKPNYIFHLAAYGTLPKENDIKKLIEVNIQGTVNLINAAKKNKFDLFVNTGSSSEYGIKDNPMEEIALPLPINDYGVTKLAATAFVYKEAIRENLPMITFRLFSPYGPYEDKSKLIPSVILSAINNNTIEIGNPNNVRDFVHIDNVVDAYIAATHGKIFPGEVFNVGSGKQHSTRQIVERVVEIVKSHSEIKFEVIKNHKRQIEPKIWKADMSKMKTILKWESKNSIESGLQKTIDWFRKNINLYS